MVIQYCRLNAENVAAITEKAKEKKDGVYTFRGIAYRVRRGYVTHYAVNGEVIERCYGFHVVIGKYTQKYGHDRKKPLMNIKGGE